MSIYTVMLYTEGPESIKPCLYSHVGYKIGATNFHCKFTAESEWNLNCEILNKYLLNVNWTSGTSRL